MRKSWVAPKDKHEDYNTLNFKILYIGIFLIGVIISSVGYFRVSLSPWGKRKGIVAYIVACFLGIVVFYII